MVRKGIPGKSMRKAGPTVTRPIQTKSVGKQPPYRTTSYSPSVEGVLPSQTPLKSGVIPGRLTKNNAGPGGPPILTKVKKKMMSRLNT